MTEPLSNDAESRGVDSDVFSLGSGGERERPGLAVAASPSATRDRPVPSASDRFTWLMSSLAFLVLLSVFLPYTVEKMTYAVARGRQRAQYDTAGEQLKQVALQDLSKAYQLVANRVGPSVVHITVTSANVESTNVLSKETGWQHPPTGQGAGVVVDSEGYIVTNEHVIRGSSRIRVKLSDGRVEQAEIIGIDRTTDLAVLKVAAGNLMPAEWGSSDDLQVGGLVWALGSPFGLEHSITFGILSAKHRSAVANVSNPSPYQDFLQTDAAVNPGNSGGPLVDSRGRIVGINTAIVGETYQGISFAIPSSVARPIYERIRREGRVTRGWLGVFPQDVTIESLERLQLDKPEGAFVARVVPNINGTPSPAQRAGIQVGDVIVRWDGQPVRGRTELFSRVAMAEVGAPVDVVVIRAGKRLTLKVTVVIRTAES